jgi:hypothetical protein
MTEPNLPGAGTLLRRANALERLAKELYNEARGSWLSHAEPRRTEVFSVLYRMQEVINRTIAGE